MRCRVLTYFQQQAPARGIFSCAPSDSCQLGDIQEYSFGRRQHSMLIEDGIKFTADDILQQQIHQHSACHQVTSHHYSEGCMSSSDSPV